MHIFLSFSTTSKTKNKPLGLCPKPHSHLRGRRGRWQTLSTYPYGECWVDSKASRVKCTTSSPLTPLHLRGGSKTNRSGRAGSLSRLAKQPRSSGLYGLEATTLCGKGAGGFPCTPAAWQYAGVGSAHGVGKTLGGPAVGENVP